MSTSGRGVVRSLANGVGQRAGQERARKRRAQANHESARQDGAGAVDGVV